MDEVPLLRLVTLWFVVLIFLRTGAGAADGPLMAAVGLVAVLLSYAIPAALVIGGAMQLLET